jgi:LysM repeat protein
MNGKMPDFSNVQSGSSSTAEKVYVVVAGDSLSKIAKREYGNANDWPLGDYQVEVLLDDKPAGTKKFPVK